MNLSPFDGLFSFGFVIMNNREGVSMSLLQPYHGTYVNASSASNQLDANAILAGCDAVDEEANYISQYAGNLSEVSSPLNERNFSVDGATMIPTIGEYCENINAVEAEIMSITSQIREMVEYQYNRIQEQLNYDAQVKDQNEYNRRRNG